MENQSASLKTVMLIVFFIIIVFYHLCNLLFDSWGWSTQDVFSIYKLAQFAVSIIFFFCCINKKLQRKFPFLPFSNICGNYYGTSSNKKFLTSADKTGEEKHDETFSIEASLLETTINGTSRFHGTEEIHSSWFGRKFHTNGDSHYFGLMATMPDKTEFGVLQLTIRDKDVNGFYFSGAQNSRKCIINAKLFS